MWLAARLDGVREIPVPAFVQQDWRVSGHA
jgi:hypothetical protein